MSMRKLTAILLILALALAACDDSVSDSAEALCSSLEGLASTVEQIAGADVDPGTVTVDDVQNATDELESAIGEVQSAESDLDDALKSQLQDDFDQLQNSISDISGDSTLADAGQDVASAISTFQQSWDETLSQLNCSTS